MCDLKWFLKIKFFRQFYYFHNIPNANGLQFAKDFLSDFLQSLFSKLFYRLSYLLYS